MPCSRITVPVSPAPFFPPSRLSRVIDAAVTKFNGCRHVNTSAISAHEDVCLDCDAFRVRKSGAWYSSPMPTVRVLRTRRRGLARQYAETRAAAAQRHAASGMVEGNLHIRPARLGKYLALAALAFGLHSARAQDSSRYYSMTMAGDRPVWHAPVRRPLPSVSQESRYIFHAAKQAPSSPCGGQGLYVHDRCEFYMNFWKMPQVQCTAINPVDDETQQATCWWIPAPVSAEGVR